MSETEARLAWAAKFDASEVDCFALFQIIGGTVGVRRRVSRSDEKRVLESRLNVYRTVELDGEFNVKLSERIFYGRRVPPKHPDAALLCPTIIVPHIEVSRHDNQKIVFASTRPSMLLVVGQSMPIQSVCEVVLDVPDTAMFESEQSQYYNFLGSAATAIGVDFM